MGQLDLFYGVLVVRTIVDIQSKLKAGGLSERMKPLHERELILVNYMGYVSAV